MSTEAHNHDRNNEILREESPVQIKGLQDTYRREFSRRFRKLRGVLRETIVENDALRIKGGNRTRVNAPEDMQSRDVFEYELSPAKQTEFRNQLQEWLEKGVLEQATEDQIKSGEHYSSVYVDMAYAQGLNFASGVLVEEGYDAEIPENAETLLSRPINVRELETAYARNYSALEDITDDIDQSLSNILTEALRKGWGTRKTADKITKEVRDIQHSRARTLARSEMLNVHNTATIRRYMEFGVTEVEILTHTPCPEICRPIASGDPYPIDNLPRGGPPFHPNCVCTIVPA